MKSVFMGLTFIVNNISSNLARRLSALAIILALSLFFRLWHLQQLPLGFHNDEVFAGYNAYSILKTGENVHGEFLPRYIDSFGDFRPAGIAYAIIPSIAIFGLNEFAVRLPIALIGAFTPLLLYLLVKQLTSKDSIALISALFLALLPWHIALSRATAEQVIAIFMVLAIASSVLLVVKSKKIYMWVLVYLLLAASFWTYTAINLFMILFIVIFSIYLWQTVPQKRSLWGWWLVILIYLVFPVAQGVIFGHATGRGHQVISLFRGGEVLKGYLAQDPPRETPLLLVRLWHNKWVIAIMDLTNRYSDYFSWNFLFFRGGPPDRYQVPGVGLLITPIVFGLFGLVGTLVQWGKIKSPKSFIFFVGWLLIAPVAAALTTDDSPNMSRASIMIVPICVLAAYGLESIIGIRKLRIGLLALVFIVTLGLWHFSYFWHQYSVHAKYYKEFSRNISSREAAKELAKIPKKYKVLAATPFIDSAIYSLFFEKIDPKIAQMAYAQKTDIGMSFSNYTFTNEDSCASKLDIGDPRKYQVFLDSYWCDEPNWSNVISLRMPDDIVGAKILIDKSVVYK